MNLGTDSVVIWQWGLIRLNLTIVTTWAVMGLLVVGSWLVTRKLKTGPHPSRWQMSLEALVSTLKKEIRSVVQGDADPYLPFVGTLFLYISISNLLSPVPVYQPPTTSISTTAALAICVFFAVPVYGIYRSGVKGYFRHYIRPTVFMLPFHLIGELSRTLALAVRLFGNVMSTTMIVALLLSVAPFILPTIMEALGLLVGQIQAYIFAVLALVYIASASRVQKKEIQSDNNKQEE